MRAAALFVAMVVFSSPAAMQAPMPGGGVDFPGKDLSVTCYGASGTATFDGLNSWDTGAMAIPGAAIPGPYTVRVQIKRKRSSTAAGPYTFDTIVATADPSPVGRPWVYIWSGSGSLDDVHPGFPPGSTGGGFTLDSAGGSSATFSGLFGRQTLSVSW
jgi:hypothetical protein